MKGVRDELITFAATVHRGYAGHGRADECAQRHRARSATARIQGFSSLVAGVTIAETGADMAVFPDAGHTSTHDPYPPGGSSGLRRCGNKYPKAALGIAALAASHQRSTTYLAVNCRRIAARRGLVKAVLALDHRIERWAEHGRQRPLF